MSDTPGHDHAKCARTKIRDGKVANRPIYVALAVTCEGNRDILGLWAGDAGAGGEGAKYWLHVLTEIKNRGVNDVLMVVCDGLTGEREGGGWALPHLGHVGRLRLLAGLRRPRKGKVRGYTIEWGPQRGSIPKSFHPDYPDMVPIIEEVTAALLAFCAQLAGTRPDPART